MKVPCRNCTALVVWLPIYNGHSRPFDPTVYADGTHDVAERWYVRRDPVVAVSADVAGSTVKPGSAYLVEHHCTGSRRGGMIPGEEEPANTKLDRARRDGPFVRDLPLQDPYCTYTYRWPSSWAHIVHHGYTAICGARMHSPVRTRPDERERLKGMPVCPDCKTTYVRTYREGRAR